MLSLPDDWDYSLKGLTVGCKDGLDSVRTAVLELEEHGYVRRQKVRNARGQIIDYDYQSMSRLLRTFRLFPVMTTAHRLLPHPVTRKVA